MICQNCLENKAIDGEEICELCLMLQRGEDYVYDTAYDQQFDEYEWHNL